MALVGDGELAVTEGVPQLDGTVAGTGDNLAVVGREGDGQDVVVVADEAAGGGARGQLPKSQGLVPRSGQGVGAVGGDNLSNFDPSAYLVLKTFTQNPASIHVHIHQKSVGTYAVRDDVGVAVQRLLGVTVLGLIASKVPDDQSLVTRAGQEHVGANRIV